MFFRDALIKGHPSFGVLDGAIQDEPFLNANTCSDFWEHFGRLVEREKLKQIRKLMRSEGEACGSHFGKSTSKKVKSYSSFELFLSKD